MQTEHLDRWAAFDQKLKALRAEFAGSNFLFRGQSNDGWGLDTTLERAGYPGCSLEHYYRVLLRVRPAIEAHTGHRWVLPTPETFRRWVTSYDAVSGLTEWKGYDFMAYLRHHGFPSPLLDWSRSPYVAAFFAFQPLTGSSDRVAIFVYQERAGNMKSHSSGRPQIRQLPEYVRTHARHFRQQCEYTVCLEYRKGGLEEDARSGELYNFHYARHDAVFDKIDFFKVEHAQDQLWKFTVPRIERAKVMQLLNDFNLNSYSLFGSEDALMSTLAEKEIRPHA
ncbi:FRG domain-containing protein [Steroidobacter flavus]|uniref:FRG domain-containing protein n=1 Tax=Steroidobacter flavus TaxID=1842136 RepID=A0ABV8SLF7_9GAMM